MSDGRDDALERIATALERIADAVTSPPPRRRRRPDPDDELEVTDIDRAKARQIARKLGFHVRNPKPR